MRGATFEIPQLRFDSCQSLGFHQQFIAVLGLEEKRDQLLRQPHQAREL